MRLRVRAFSADSPLGEASRGSKQHEDADLDCDIQLFTTTNK